MVDSGPNIERIAAAPISWGISEVPGWGHQLEREQVLDEMRALGLTATEFGPAGFLPTDPAEKREYLHTKGLRAVGGFLPVVLHDPGHDPMPEVDAFLKDCLATGATVMVLAAATGVDGYDEKPCLTDEQWVTLYDNVNRISGRSAEVGITTAVHPHLGTVIENAGEVERVLIHSEAQLCIDTGHLVAAGADPVALTTANPGRVGHVHLKDVDPILAAEVQAGAKSFSQAVTEGLFCPLGSGAVDVAAMIAVLESVGYDGWYVLEQDLKLEAGMPAGGGPSRDVQISLRYVLDALADIGEVSA